MKSLMTSFMQITRQEWFVRVNLLIPHRHFVLESPMESGTLFRLTIILVLPNPGSDTNAYKRCSFIQHGGMHDIQCARLSRWLLPTAHARERYSADSGQHSKRYAMGVACYAARVIKCPGYFNRLMKKLFRTHRGYAQTYFDDIFIHSRAMNVRSDVDNQ